MFFGPSITTVFTSRWKALFWSAGVLATAYCSIPAVDEAKDSAEQKAASDAASAQSAQP